MCKHTSYTTHLWQIQNVSRKVLGEPLFNRLMKATVYGQFVGGEDHDNLKGVIGQLKSDGIFPVLDYAVENDIGDEEEVSLETRYTIWCCIPQDIDRYCIIDWYQSL